MKKLFYFLLASISALILNLSACSDEALMPDTGKELDHATQGSRLAIALCNAEAFFSQMGESTRSPRTVSNVSTICSPLTRNGEQDTLFFIVNYGEDQGFAVLGADPGRNDIYAIAPAGNLTVEDVNATPFLSDFMNDVYEHTSIIPPTDSIKFSGRDMWAYVNENYQKPLLNPIVNNWHQLNPYNTAVDMYAAGCVPVAVGSLLSFYRQPDSLNYFWNIKTIPQFDFNWNLMLASPQEDLSDLTVSEMFAFLGCDRLLNTKYISDQAASTSVANISHTIITLGGYGLLFENESLTDSFEDVINFILYGKKVIKLRYDLKYEFAPVLAYGKGEEVEQHHVWVIDGVVTRKKYMVDYRGVPIEPIPIGGHPTYYPAIPLWHCVWGQTNKKWDGWFAYLKDTNKLDSIQYNPFGNKGYKTGIKMSPVYKDWTIFGGCFPKTIIKIGGGIQ